MSTSGQADQKGRATWTFRELIRLPILPLIWVYSYLRGQSNENRNTDAYPSNETIRTHDTLHHENEKEEFTLKKDNSELMSRNEQLQKHSCREQDAITLNKDCIQLLTRNRTVEHLCKDKEDEEEDAFTLKEKCSQSQSRNEQLQKQSCREQDAITLNKDCIQLLTRNRTVEHLCKDKEDEEEDAFTLKEKCSQLQSRNQTLETLYQDKEQETFALKDNCSKLQSRNEELKKQLSSHEQEVFTLNRDCSQLRTRLSQIAAMQLTEGNPNIADLSDQNRPDKLAEQFSELYDNQWTDCYQVLVDNLGRTEEDSISILLKIVKTSYDTCLAGCQNTLTTTKDILFAFAGRSDEEPDKALDALIQEILHKLKSYRTKSFKAVPTNIGKEIRVELISKIGEPETDACGSFIEECIRTCWLMCIKDPPMYIFCDQEAVFDKDKYMEYTEMGHKVAFVVWPALYLHKNGPLMRKGVAQGEGKKDRKQSRKANAATSQLPEPDHIQQYNTGIKDMTKGESDRQEKETQAHKSEEMASADDSLIKTDVNYNEDNGNDYKIGLENDTQTAYTVENGSWEQKQKDDSFRVLPEDESTGRDYKTDDKLTLSKEYCQGRELSGGISINRQESPGNDRRNGNVACSSGQNGDEDSSSIYEPSKKNICDSPNDAEQDETLQSTSILISSNSGSTVNEEGNFQSAPKDEKTESKEQSDYKLISLNEYCQQRETPGATNTNEEENQGKEKEDGFIKYNNGQEVKEGINIVHAPLATNVGASNNDAEEQERPQLINVRSSSDDSLKEEKAKKNSHSLTKGETTEIKEKPDNKLVSSNEYCQQRETLGATNKNEEENQGKEIQDGFIECNNGQEVKESINIIHASPAKNIRDSLTNAEEEETPHSIDVRNSSDDNWKDGKEKCFQASTKDEAMESKEQACNINEEDNQGTEMKHGLIECINVQEVKEAAHIVNATSDKTICNSPNDVEQDERPKSTNVCSSSDYDCNEDKEEEDVQSSTKDGATESNEQADHKLLLQDQYCQQMETLGDSQINEKENQGWQKEDWVILCSNGQEVNEAVTIAHERSEKNKCDSSNDTEQDKRLSATNNRSSSDDNKNKDKDNADFHASPSDDGMAIAGKEIANVGDSTDKSEGEELHGKAL